MKKLLEKLLKKYESAISAHRFEVFLCNIIKQGNFTKKEKDRLIKFMQDNRPLNEGTIGYDCFTITYIGALGEGAYWLSRNQEKNTLNYQSRINFLKAHIKRLSK